MMFHEYAQLPAMDAACTIKGTITWQTIGRTLTLGADCHSAFDCIEEVIDVNADTSLFAAIPQIVDRGFSLIRDSTRAITGIVITANLSLQFRQLAEPFLPLGETTTTLGELATASSRRTKSLPSRIPTIQPERSRTWQTCHSAST